MRDRGLTFDPLGVNDDGELVYTVAMGRLSTLRMYAGAALITAALTLLEWGCAVVPEFAREKTVEAIRRSVADEEDG